MNIEFFKKLADNIRKVKWNKKAATWNGHSAPVEDVDLNGRVSLDAPLSATVRLKDGTVITGAFWPKDKKPESVVVNGEEMQNGQVGLAGEPKWFPPGVEIRLRFRWNEPGNPVKQEFIVTGKIGGLDALGVDL